MRMMKAETYEKALRFWYKRDLFLVDEIYHPEYSTFADTTGITANLEGDKTVVLSPRDRSFLILVSVFLEWRSIAYLNLQHFQRGRIYSFTTEADYREGRISTQKTMSKELNNDLSKV